VRWATAGGGGLLALFKSTYWGLCVFSFLCSLFFSGSLLANRNIGAGLGLLLGAGAALWAVKRIRDRGGLSYLRHTVRSWWARATYPR
jgi:hypothetical protein